jgi:hypothetical protein
MLTYANRWPKKYFLTIIIAFLIWVLFSIIGPGDDFYGAYTWMVLEPGRLPQVADYPWTLNPPWIVPFLAPFVTLPGRAGYILFTGVMIAMILHGAYLLGGKLVPILLSAHMLWILWWGQLEGWGVIGLILGIFSLKRRSWLLMFLALAISAFKPQIGFVPALALWWWSGKDRWKSMSAFILLFVLSIIVWGPWPKWYLEGITGFVGNQHHSPWNASIGLVALPLFIPAVLIPMDREKRLIALTATTYIISPYMPYYSTILLLCFGIPWWAYLFGFLGFFPEVLGTRIAWNGNRFFADYGSHLVVSAFCQNMDRCPIVAEICSHRKMCYGSIQ